MKCRRKRGVLRSIGGHKSAGTVLLAVAAVFFWSATASAQLDPLTLLRRTPPTVIVVMDTSLAMLQDGNGNFYDPGFFSTTADPLVMSAFPSINTSTTKTYRRIFRSFNYAASPGKYTSSLITAVAAAWDPANPLTSNAPGDSAFLDPTRYAIAKTGLAQAVNENSSTARWGLIRLRQKTPAWRSTPGGASTGGNDCDKPVTVSDFTQSIYGDTTPCNAGGLGKYATYAPSVAAASYAQTTAPAGTVMVTPGAGTAPAMLNIVNRAAGDSQALIPAGIGGVGYVDRPLSYALDDAKQAAINAIAADTASCRSCRNTIVVLITGGKDSGDSTYLSSNDVTARASQFVSVSSSGVTHRVPIYVIGVRVAAAEEAQLQTVATNSGGAYHNVSSASEVASWIDYAIQAGYGRSTELDTAKVSEFSAVSPIVGTVNLTGGKDANGAALPNDVIHIGGVSSNAVVPQRSNVLLSAGFELPGFYGRLRAFRTYQPVADSTKPSGYKFVKDGTRLWPDLDSRPSLAGQARTPADPNSRNIYTYVPNGSGGGSVVAFTAANASTLAPHLNMNTTSATTLINYVRTQPIGAIIGSTPGLMDPPSLDPPPDDDYGRPDAAGTFAGNHANRRSIIFVGANDGMMHAIDARTGYEVWAFIPYNLLPKLRTLADGQSVEQFEYFVDSSPKMAEVKIGGSWHSLLLFGEGPGGTFYQCFDVSEAGMGVDPTLGDLTAVNNLLAQFDTPNESIAFKWAFPNYNHFDPTYKQVFTLADGTFGNKLTMWGDLNSSATYAEKTVGFTWSDPAVGPLNSDRSTNAIIVGSGYFPAIENSLPNRGVSAPRAGATMYLLNADTGALIGNASGSACTGTGCLSLNDVSNGRKNALQADPTAAGDYASPVVKKAYLGDIDGRYWRFDFTSSGSLTSNLMADTGQPIYASSALLFVGSTDIYMFFATGSDMLPATTSGGSNTFKMYGLKDNYPGSGSTTKFSNDFAPVSMSGGFLNGERASASPTVAGDIVFYTSTIEDATAPCADVTATLYSMTYLGGSAYVENNSNGSSRVIARTAGRATAPFIVDQHLYFATTGAGGTNIQAFGDSEDFNNGVGQVGVRILSWREIR